MNVSAPDKQLANRAYTTTVEFTSAEYVPHPSAQTTTLLVASSTDGTFDVDALMTDGVWREVLTNEASVGAVLNIVIIHIRPRAVRVRFTPTTAPGTCVIDGSYSGYGQPA